MARFQFLSRSLPTSSRSDTPSIVRLLRDWAPADTREAPQGPGWFDSSFDLWHGLEVRDAGAGGYDDWLAARAIAESRAATRRAARTPRSASPVPRAPRDDVPDLADLANLAELPARAQPEVPAPVDDFSRFGIDGLALA